MPYLLCLRFQATHRLVRAVRLLMTKAITVPRRETWN